jgi:hypothetical protein
LPLYDLMTGFPGYMLFLYYYYYYWPEDREVGDCLRTVPCPRMTVDSKAGCESLLMMYWIPSISWKMPLKGTPLGIFASKVAPVGRP